MSRVDYGEVSWERMIGVGLVDAAWPSRFPRPLAAHLQELLDNPDG